MQQNEPDNLAGSKVVRTRTDDGFKFYMDDGSWVLMRMSGTEPLMRVYAEATTRERVEQLITALENQSGVNAPRRGGRLGMTEVAATSGPISPAGSGTSREAVGIRAALGGHRPLRGQAHPRRSRPPA